MKWKELEQAACPVARSLAVVGDRWTLLILRNALLRTRRFDDFQTQLGLTRHLLSSRLAKLVRHGVMVKVPYQERPRRYEYRLTDMGRDWLSVQLALLAWGDRWLGTAEGPPLELLHRGCGHRFHARTVCSECGEALTLDAIQAIGGPGLRPPSVPAESEAQANPA